MAWPAVCESFFVALAGMVDSLMVSSIGSYAVRCGFAVFFDKPNCFIRRETVSSEQL